MGVGVPVLYRVGYTMVVYPGSVYGGIYPGVYTRLCTLVCIPGYVPWCIPCYALRGIPCYAPRGIPGYATRMSLFCYPDEPLLLHG